MPILRRSASICAWTPAGMTAGRCRYAGTDAYAFWVVHLLQNPAQLQVENRALQQEERLLSGGVCVTPAGRRATVITGKGWWYGGRALEMAQVLRRLLLPGQAHWLFAPGAEPMRAYLTRFDYTCTTARDGVQYSFTFTEDCDPAPRYAPYGSTRVRQGENAFDIAARTGVSVDTIVALNRLASPFDLTPGEKVVLA